MFIFYNVQGERLYCVTLLWIQQSDGIFVVINSLCVSTWAEREEKERIEREKREQEQREYQERVKKLEELEKKKRQREMEIEERERRREEERRGLDDPFSRKVGNTCRFGSV